MNNYTPNDWIAIMTAAGVLITAVGSAITGILAVLLNRKVNHNDLKATAARTALGSKIDVQAGTIRTLEKNTNSIKDALVASTAEANLAAGRELGRKEGKAEEQANPTVPNSTPGTGER